MQALKYDAKTKEYAVCGIPDGATTYTTDMDKEIACAACGRSVRYGDCFPSQKFYEASGMFAYVVCDDCHGKDLDEQWSEWYKSHLSEKVRSVLCRIANEDHSAYFKAVLSIEGVSDDEEVLDKLYDRYMNSTIGLVDEEFYSLADEFSEGKKSNMAERVVIIDATGTAEASENTVVIPVSDKVSFQEAYRIAWRMRPDTIITKIRREK